MAKRGRKPKTKEDQSIVEIEQQYLLDRLMGEGWRNQIEEMLNMRYAEGWKYIPPFFRIGESNEWNSSLGRNEYIYGILYEKIAKSAIISHLPFEKVPDINIPESKMHWERNL